MQSNMRHKDKLHIAIIMDGNGRWATAKGLPRTSGHLAGVAALRDVIKAAPRMRISTLTVYAFSSDNWRRPAAEVAVLMAMLHTYLVRDLPNLINAGVRLIVIGRRDRLPDSLGELLTDAETASMSGTQLTLRLAIDYSSRDSILAAIATCSCQLTREEVSQRLAGGSAPADVDLLIRTSGEKRLSDFLLWEAAYAELYFTDRLWPDFRAGDLALALEEFGARHRRFGGLPIAAQRSPDPIAYDLASGEAASAS